MDRATYTLIYDVAPIMLTHGLAGDLEGAMISILNLTDPGLFPGGVLSDALSVNLDDYFAHYIPVDASLVDQDAATYPYANQSVAANAVIENPLVVSLRMICPVKDEGGFARLNAVMTNLQTQLRKHNLSGGTYSVATAPVIYTECLMSSFRQVSAGPAQPHAEWRMDFRQPLLTLAQAVESQNALMNKLTSGTAFMGKPAWSGGEVTVGLPPTLATGVISPAASGQSGAVNVSPFGFSPGTGSVNQ